LQIFGAVVLGCKYFWAGNLIYFQSIPYLLTCFCFVPPFCRTMRRKCYTTQEGESIFWTKLSACIHWQHPRVTLVTHLWSTGETTSSIISDDAHNKDKIGSGTRARQRKAETPRQAKQNHKIGLGPGTGTGTVWGELELSPDSTLRQPRPPDYFGMAPGYYTPHQA